MQHRASLQEIVTLLAVADRDLADSRVAGLSTDNRFACGYNAALQLAAAALAAAGYRPARTGSHHHYVIQSLSFTIGAEADLINKFDSFRKKRNISAYERAGAVSDQEADEMAELARTLRSRVEDWIRQTHPELLP